MSRQRGQTSIELRKLIIKHKENGKSVREISEIVKRSHSTVHDIKRYKTNNQVENKSKKAHNKIFTEADERYLVRKVKVNPFLSAPKLAIIAENKLGKKANPSTIRNVLHKKNLTGRKARQKPFISKRNQKVRREFAKERENKNLSYWKQVLLTDESKFNIFGSDGNPYVWRKSNEELRRQNLKLTVKHGGGSVMVWGSFSAAGLGTLHSIEGRVDQNDNDPKHKAYRVRSWLLYNCPQVMETPPQSPDIIPIENLWDHLNKKVREHAVSSKTELKRVLLQEWDNIQPNFCEKLVQSMP
ncbi:transposable element Tc1 transposase [Trichonephila clavipes]|nr:transposable element Tc1 transposase [Trichonephila clavipes]